MHATRRFVVIIGQIPPPTDGLAYITLEFTKLLSEDHDVKILNISPKIVNRGLAYHVFRTVTVLCASIHLLLNAWRENRVCYMPCQSDFGLLYTIYLLLLARLLKYPTYLHHHNFGYISERRQLMATALRAGGPNIVHIFLCEHMRESFSETYCKPERFAIISNAAFVSPGRPQPLQPRTASLKIGLLSNLNRDKGLYHFLELLRSARDAGLTVHGILAGPARLPHDKSAIALAQQELGDLLHYKGPLYGEDKIEFYRSIDAFIFPTNYTNEAQPTVIYEALAAGNLIVAYERGCIASQVGKNGMIVSRTEAFAPAALEYLRTLSANTSTTTSRPAIVLNMAQLHAAERAKARALLEYA